jgi:methylmalonyl-CoA/ethylmalonyl-CoA epimerase
VTLTTYRRRGNGVKRATTRPSPVTLRHTLTDMTDSTLPADLFTMIDHVGVAVPDLDEAIAFYSEKYGMRMLHEEVNEEQGVREAMMAVGDSGSCIQLLAPLSPESRWPTAWPTSMP